MFVYCVCVCVSSFRPSALTFLSLLLFLQTLEGQIEMNSRQDEASVGQRAVCIRKTRDEVISHVASLADICESLPKRLFSPAGGFWHLKIWCVKRKKKCARVKVCDTKTRSPPRLTSIT